MFIVLRVEAINEHLHGYVSRFLHEIDTSTYVGKMNKKTLEKLWENVTQNMTQGKAYIIISDNSKEEGFTMQTTPNCTFTAENHGGIILIHKRNTNPTDKENGDTG